MANDKPAPHTIVIPNLSGKILSDLLQSNGWTRGTSDIVAAGNIMSEDRAPARLPDRIPESLYVPVSPERPDELRLPEQALRTWGDAELMLELTEKEREVCKFVIDFFAKSGKIPPSRYAYKLLVAFKFE